MDAAFNYKVRNGRYRQENKISDVVASRRFGKNVDLGLLIPVGEKRGRIRRGTAPKRHSRQMLG